MNSAREGVVLSLSEKCVPDCDEHRRDDGPHDETIETRRLYPARRRDQRHPGVFSGQYRTQEMIQEANDERAIGVRA